jgi:hypothetical protein
MNEVRELGRAITDLCRWWLALPVAVLCGLGLYVLLWVFRCKEDYTLDDLM